MSDKMVTLATFPNAVEAGLFRNELESMGIRAAILGDESSNVFGGLGFSHVQILVPEANLEQALDLLGQWENRGLEEEPVEEEFSDSSTAFRPEQESPLQAPPPLGQTRDQPDSGVPQEKSSPPGPEGHEGEEIDAEFKAAEEEEDEGKRPLTWTADDRAARAFRAALFGSFLCPVIFHIYSFSILIEMMVICGGWPQKELTRAGNWHVFGALVFDFIWLFLAGCFLVAFFSY